MSTYNSSEWGKGWGHHDPPGVVRIGCLGERSWKAVQGVADSVRWVGGDAQVVELEQELEQSELNNESVEKAYNNYLTKLEAVSNLDMMGICRAKEREPVADAYYIFGRTVGKPNLLYFRKYQTDKTWTSWEKIDIDFEGDHLIPIVYNNKLHIFWPIFTTKTEKAY